MWVSTGHSQHLCSCPEGGGNALKKHLQMMIQQILNTQAIVLHVNARNTQLDASFWGRTFQNLKVVSLGSPTPPRAPPQRRPAVSADQDRGHPARENRSPVGMGPWGADPTRWYTPGACRPETRAGVSSRKGAAPLCRPRGQGGRRAQTAPMEALRLKTHP